MPDLKKVVFGNAVTSSFKFAEGQAIEYFKLYRCNNVEQLDLRHISESLSTVRFNDCDGLLGANFKNFMTLKSVDVNGCNKMGSINLTGCTSLESFSLNDNSAKVLNVTDCSSLKRLTWSTSLESLIHDGADAIEYVDGSVIAQIGLPSMHIPIQYAITYPERFEGIKSKSFSFSDIARLDFQKPDVNKFKALRIAYECGKLGGSVPICMNAANEEAVFAFLEGRIKLFDIIKSSKRRKKKL